MLLAEIVPLTVIALCGSEIIPCCLISDWFPLFVFVVEAKRYVRLIPLSIRFVFAVGKVDFVLSVALGLIVMGML